MKKILNTLKKAYLPVMTLVIFGLIGTTAFAAHTIDTAVDDGEAITIDGTNNVIRVDDAGNNCDTPLSATLTAGTYTPTEMADEIKNQLQATLTGTTITVTYNYETRLFKISGSVDGDSICWADGSDTAHTALGYDAVNDLDIDTTDADQDTAFSIGDRIYASGAEGSDSILLEMEIDVSSAGDNVTNIGIDPPANWTIRGWNIFNDDDGDDGADAIDNPDMDNNTNDTVGCADPDSTTAITTCSGTMPTAGQTLNLTLQSPVGNTETLVLQIWVDAPATAELSGEWIISTIDSNFDSDSERFSTVAADDGDIAFEMYNQGDPLDGDVSESASGNVYIYDDDGANLRIDYNNIKKTLYYGMALYEEGVELSQMTAANGTFDYAVTGTDESRIADNETWYYDAVTSIKEARIADVADPSLSNLTVDRSSTKNELIFDFSEPVFYDNLILDTSRTMASTPAFGDSTSTSTGLVFEGLGEWTDTDGQPNTTSMTGANKLRMDNELDTLTLTSNGQTTTSDVYYYTNTATGVTSDGANDDFTVGTSVFTDAAGNNLSTGAIGGGAITFNTAWDVTPPDTPTSLRELNTSFRFSWNSILDPGDFYSYLIFYDTSSIDETTGSSYWGRDDDTNLNDTKTNETTLTTLADGTDYYLRNGAVDTSGNIALSDEITYNSTPTTTTGGGGTALPPVTDEEIGIPGEEEPVSPPDGVTGPMFYDIADHWAREEIEAMGEENVVEGDPDGGFRPDDGLNRAEAAALLYRVLGLGTPEIPTEKPFSDVEVDAWYAGYVNELKDMELLFGNPDGTYEPGENINRAEFLSMAMNVYYFISDADTQSAIDDLMEGPMTDMYEDLLEDQWYTSEVTAATEMGFVHGSVCNDGRCFYSGNEVTRAEATVMLYNMFYYYLTQ